ncbi:hypothetical protein TNCV_1025821 [Trichonephila clavipes]|nr:hypothetical protein TNCV_1025821 [Trichonephila clavipes]
MVSNEMGFVLNEMVSNETVFMINFKLEQAEREAAHRDAETPERSQAWRRRHAEYLTSQRAAETPEQSQTRRLQHATFMVSQRDTETIEAAESRKRTVAERAQQRRLIFTKNTNADFAVLLNGKRESTGMCCSGGGEVALPSIDEPVEPLNKPFSYETDESLRFLKKHMEIQYRLPCDIFWDG